MPFTQLTRMNLVRSKLACASIRPCRGISSTAVRSMAQIDDMASTMPPGYRARVGRLETSTLLEKVTGTKADRALGKALGMSKSGCI